jgi:hypothetical protein
MADPTLDQIEKHGEDCYQPLAVAKADLEQKRAELTKALRTALEAHDRSQRIEDVLAGAFRDANKRSRAALPAGDGEAARELRRQHRDRYHAGKYVQGHVFAGFLGNPRDKNGPVPTALNEARAAGVKVD